MQAPQINTLTQNDKFHAFMKKYEWNGT